MSDPHTPSPGDQPPQGDPQQGYQQQGDPQQRYQQQGPPPQAYPPQNYPQQGYQQPYGAAPAEDPGKTLGIIGLVLSFFTAIIGLIISIVALRKSKKAGFKNTPALIGIIVGIVSTIVAIIIAIVAIVAIVGAAAWTASQCAQLGPGVHNVNGVTVTCS